MQRLMGLAFAGILVREVFAGMLRYGLDHFGLGLLWFLPDLALMAAIGLVLLDRLGSRVEDRYFYALMTVAFFLAVGTASGYAHGNNTASVVSAVKIALPLIALVIARPQFVEARLFRLLVAALFLCAVAGVFYNRGGDMPWTGYSISQFGIARTASRQWWIDGQSRLAGFGAGSAPTANILLLLALLCARGRTLALKAAIYGLGIAAIYFTTSRTPLIALAGAGAVDLWPRRLGREQGFDRIPLTLIFLLATLAPVAYSMVVVLGDDVARYDMSFLDRLHYTWPMTLANTYDSGWAGFLFGQGFGSSGSPAIYSGKYVSPVSAVDNFMLYMFAIFGALSLVMALLIYLCFVAIPRRDRPFAFAACLMMATLSCEGIGGSILVGLCVAFGLAALPIRRRLSALPAHGAGPELPTAQGGG